MLLQAAEQARRLAAPAHAQQQLPVRVLLRPGNAQLAAVYIVRLAQPLHIVLESR